MNKINFNNLPNEILLNVFKHLELSDLLNIFLIENTKVKHILNKVLIDRLQDIKLRIYFNQENNWKYTMDFKLAKATCSRLAFTPVSNNQMKFYTSVLLKKPFISRIDFHENNQQITINQHLKNNLLKNCLGFNIKNLGSVQNIFDEQQRLLFVYNVSKPLPNMKVRSGERLIEPLGFECPITFFSQPKTKLQKLTNHLHQKPNLTSTFSNTFSSSSRIHTQKKQLVEVDQFCQRTTTENKKPTIRLIPILQD